MHKRSLYTLSGLGLLMVGLLVLIGTIKGTAAPSDLETPSPAYAPPTPGKEDADLSGNSVATGVPAIIPRLTGTDATTPAFTEQDVVDFVNQQPDSLGRISVQNGPPTITKVQFLTVTALRQQVADAVNLTLPADTLVCYVLYKGDFSRSSPMNPKPLYYDTAMQVFDAHTGNLLMTGTGNPIQK